ncbi:MipA/OmpV family protein [Stenotrophomonas rhizophila]
MDQCTYRSRSSVSPSWLFGLIAASGLACAFDALADDTGPVPDERTTTSDQTRWGIGLGAAILERPYKDYDRETKVVPILYVDNRWLSVNGGRFDFKINRSETLNLRLRARYALDGYDSDDSPFLAGMNDRDDSAWVGAAVVWKPAFAEFSAEYLTDAMDNSEGSRFRVEVERRFAAGRFGFTPRLAADWLDAKYVGYYYGVRPDEVLPLRAAYAGEATTNLEAGLRIDYSPGARHTFFLDASAVKLGSAIKDSPLTGKSDQVRVTAGYLFHF